MMNIPSTKDTRSKKANPKTIVKDRQIGCFAIFIQQGNSSDNLIFLL